MEITKEEKPKRKFQPKPSWIKMKIPTGEKYLEIKSLLKKLNLATVCEEAKCPNVSECWAGGTATFMLMGEECTRGCRFCSVKSSNKPAALDLEEPQKVGSAIAKMGLEYVVLTSVDRDDLEDAGAGHFAETIEVIKAGDPDLIVEVLTPDFSGDRDLIKKVVDAKPDVFAQNVETVERLTRQVRDRRAGYWQTLDLLKYVKDLAPDRYTKTSIMLGLSETDDEVKQTLKDLRGVGCDVVTFGS
ncbi:lipoyl synthase [bacterium]|nr:lipoyl synthase [bacterium]